MSRRSSRVPVLPRERQADRDDNGAVDARWLQRRPRGGLPQQHQGQEVLSSPHDRRRQPGTTAQRELSFRVTEDIVLYVQGDRAARCC